MLEPALYEDVTGQDGARIALLRCMRPTSGVVSTTESKRFAVFSVALCLALAGAGVGLVVARDHHDHASDLALRKDLPEQPDVQNGWRALETLAASFPPAEQSNAPAAFDGSSAHGSPTSAPPLSTTPPGPSNQGVMSAPGGSSIAGDAGWPSGGSAAGIGGTGQVTPPVNGVANSPAIPANVAVGAGSASIPAAEAPAEPSGQPTPVPAPTSSPVSLQALGYSRESVMCGPNTCNLGQVCCNASCGTCAAPGATCDQTRCDNAITYPESQACGMATCNVDSVCCNPSCGICAAPGAECSRSAC